MELQFHWQATNEPAIFCPEVPDNFHPPFFWGSLVGLLWSLRLSVPKRRGWEKPVPIVTATLAMPLCPTDHTALPALISLAPGTVDTRHNWTSSRPTHCQLAQPACLLACLLACRGGFPPQAPFPFACLLLFKLGSSLCPAPDNPTLGKMWISLPFSPPCLVPSVGPVPLVSLSRYTLDYGSTLDLFGSFSPPCSPPKLPLFPTDQLTFPTSIMHTGCDLVDLRERYTCHITFPHIPRRITATAGCVHAGGNIL